VSARQIAQRMVTDVRPLRHSVDYRRLWFGLTVSQLGQQMTQVAVAYQVYTITGSSVAVGVVGICVLVPLVGLGLYGGAVADALDRRLLALAASCGLCAMSILLVAQAAADVRSTTVLYAVVAVQSGCLAIEEPARTAIIPRLLPPALMPAANALSMASYNIGFTVGPLVGGLLIASQGVTAAYVLDSVTFGAALYALVRLPPMRPREGQATRPGLRSVVEGLRFLRRTANLRMTFICDMCAMVLAQPRALFPAIALTVYANGAGTLGLLQAAPATGALIAFAFSGWVSAIHRHGLAIVIAVGLYGVAIVCFGVTAIAAPGLIWLGVVFLALSGSADMVSAAYRSTMLQVASPDRMRGRLQGVFVVVVAGGPRLGDFTAGALGGALGERTAVVVGGTACVVGVLLSASAQRGFLRYDARDPVQ
jgi:MFS family permease